MHLHLVFSYNYGRPQSTFTHILKNLYYILCPAKIRYYLSNENQNYPIFLKPAKSSIMKRRVRKIANFFAFNLLFFALYLNFIHKDKSNLVTTPPAQQTSSNAAFSGTVLVENPEQIIKKETIAAQTPAQKQATENNDGVALKLSIN
jgi:hypothetical protein